MGLGDFSPQEIGHDFPINVIAEGRIIEDYEERLAEFLDQFRNLGFDRAKPKCDCGDTDLVFVEILVLIEFTLGGRRRQSTPSQAPVTYGHFDMGIRFDPECLIKSGAMEQRLRRA